MKIYARLLLAVILAAAGAACDGCQGYLGDSQQIVVDRLTGCQWRMTYMHAPDIDPVEYTTEGFVYKFNRDGSGWYRWAGWTGAETESAPEYFRWSFTNSNFAVIRIAGDIPEYWLIESLTSSALNVQSSFSDPVIYPDQSAVERRFVAVR